MKAFVAVLLVAGTVFGCAHPADVARERGDWETAFIETENEAQKGNPQAINNLGNFYVEGRHVSRDLEKGVAYWTLAARMGNQNARMNLAKAGRPIPESDLVRRSGSNYDPALTNLGLQLLQMGQPRSLGNEMNCSTYQNGPYGTINCR